MDNLDFAKEAKALGIKAVEYVNQFFKDKATDEKYLAEMKKRAKDNGVKSLLIMCDDEGHLGDPDAKRRRTRSILAWTRRLSPMAARSMNPTG